MHSIYTYICEQLPSRFIKECNKVTIASAYCGALVHVNGCMILKDGGTHSGKQRYLILYRTSSRALSVTASWVRLVLGDASLADELHTSSTCTLHFRRVYAHSDTIKCTWGFYAVLVKNRRVISMCYYSSIHIALVQAYSTFFLPWFVFILINTRNEWKERV